MEQRQQHNDEISLKDLILLIQEYIKEIIGNWRIVALITLPFMVWFGYSAINTAPFYQAETKFYMEGEGSSGGGLGGLLGQFGFKSGSGKNNPYQVLEVGNSRLLLTDVLFEKIQPNNEYLVNEIIETYELNKRWSEDNQEYHNFSFQNKSVENFSDLEKVALIKIQNIVLRGNKEIGALRAFTFEEDKGFYEIKTNTLSENITTQLNTITYQKVKEFYEEKAMTNYINTRDILKYKADSLKSLVETKMFQLNRFGDRSRSLVSLEVGTKRDILQREINGLSLAQIEAIKQYEIAEFNLQTKRNQFMLIEKPFDPLFPQAKSPLFEIVKAIILGLLLSIGFIVCRKIFKDVMA